MTVMRMPLPTQTMPNYIPLPPKRKVLPIGLHGRLENVLEGATNQRCPVGSAGNVGCQKPFVGDLTVFLTHGSLLRSAQHGCGAIFEIGASGGLLPLFQPDIELGLPARRDEDTPAIADLSASRRLCD